MMRSGSDAQGDRQEFLSHSSGGSVGNGERRGEGVDLGMIEVQENFRGREGDQAAFVEESDSLAEEEGFSNVVGDEDDGFVEAASEGAEFALKFGASDRIEGAEGLVHEENRRIGG